MQQLDLPLAAPDDSVMAGGDELRAMQAWVLAAFGLGGRGDGHVFLDAGRLPFSFRCDGLHSDTFLPGWRRSDRLAEHDDRIVRQVDWQDPRSGLRVSAEIVAWARFPAVEWVLYLSNTGDAPAPMVEQLQTLDLLLQTQGREQTVFLDQLEGDSCGESSFHPRRHGLGSEQVQAFAPHGGRSSDRAFPFFSVEQGDQGAIFALGWSGQWAASVSREPDGRTRVRAGQERTRLVLHPGERIRGPRMLAMPWRGDAQQAHNRFRRLMLFHYLPRVGGRPVRLPFALQTFDRYSWTVPQWATENGQREAARAAKALGFDTLWLDAAWFPGGFPHGVGNWSHKPEAFPRGLRPVAEACHAEGLRFLVWFEPERVANGTDIAREHPRYVFVREHDHLFRLGDDEARAWLTDLLSARIEEYGIDVYRNDFNTEPLDCWRRQDSHDRQGMTEIRYLEGLYAMWDALRARHPGLWIDNCASGGRRIDLETCMRSVPLWRSDTNCWAGHPDWNQAQTMGLGRYLPLSSGCSWSPAPYDMRSAATAGLACEFDYRGADFPAELARRTLAEVRQNQPFWYGDLYWLTPCCTASDQFTAYQLHRPDLDAGIVLAFRRSACALSGVAACLHALDPEASYEVVRIDENLEQQHAVQTGAALAAGTELRIPGRPGSLLLRYRREP